MRHYLLSISLIFFSIILSAQVKYVDYPGQPGPDGLVRCASVEVLEVQKLKRKASSAQDFEKWLNPIIKKQKKQTRTNNDTLCIPVVVHVFHNGEPVGTAPNITDSQVLSQIQVMNEDYLKLAGTNGDNSDPVGASSMIKFVMAKTGPDGTATDGINRVNIGQDGATRDDIEGGLKQNSQWNPTQYMNMWSLKFAAPDDNLLGYAQFPEASGLEGMPTGEETAETDGVVMRYNSFGTLELDDGTFLIDEPYHLGRTVTHEVGHFLGLRHVWGDGIGCNMGGAPPNCSCSEDDYCEDTPNSDQANYGCPTGKTSACDAPDITEDMIENYMDYSDDGCMNIFTIDQVARMAAVMTNSPRRMELPFSPALSPPTPRVTFETTNMKVTEGTSCNSQDIVVDINIGLAPSELTKVVFSNIGDAVNGFWKDYTFSPDTVFFQQGDDTPQQLTISVYEDAIVESNENIIIAIDTVITTGDAIKSSFDNTLTIKVNNDDFDPLHAAFLPNSALLEENFDAGFPVGWINNSPLTSHNWVVGNAANGIDGGVDSYAYVSRSELPGDLYSYNQTAAALSFLETPNLDMTYWKNMYINFTYMVVGEEDAIDGTLYDYGSLLYSIDGGTSWTRFGPDLVNTPVAQTISVDLPNEVDHEPNVKIAFRWINDELVGIDPPLSIDDVLIAGSQGVPVNVAQAVTTTPSEVYIGPMHDVYVYNGMSNNLVARFKNLSAHDYGCTSVDVDRAGVIAIEGKPSGDQVALSIIATPTNNTVSGNYEVTTYYEDINLEPWLTPTNNGCEDETLLKSIRSDGSINGAMTYNDFEKDRNSVLESSYKPSVSEIIGSYTSSIGGFGMADYIFSNTIYVDQSATGEAAGAYWEDAYSDLQTALDKIASCNTLNEIRMAAGTYLPTKDVNGNESPADPRDLTFKIQNDLDIIGGFAGDVTLEENNDLSLRDLVVNATVLSGDLNEDDIPVFINYEDNVKLLLQQALGISNMTLDGLTISNGNGENLVKITQPSTLKNVILKSSIVSPTGYVLLIDGLTIPVILEDVDIINNDGQSGKVAGSANVTMRGVYLLE